jgi:hypothetical protein
VVNAPQNDLDGHLLPVAAYDLPLERMCGAGECGLDEGAGLFARWHAVGLVSRRDGFDAAADEVGALAGVDRQCARVAIGDAVAFHEENAVGGVLEQGAVAGFAGREFATAAVAFAVHAGLLAGVLDRRAKSP